MVFVGLTTSKAMHDVFVIEVTISVQVIGDPPPRFDTDEVGLLRVWLPDTDERGLVHMDVDTVAAGWFSQ